MIRERIMGFLQNRLSPNPPDLEHGPDPDPGLVALLDTEFDEAFHDGRDDAIEKLSSLDIAALWLQAVGDGSPLDAASHDPLETKTPHRMAWQAGFDDTLDHHKITQISHQLFAHHLGTIVTPVGKSVSDRAALDNILQPSLEYATDLYGGEDNPAEEWEAVQYPRPTSLDDTTENARSLLETDSLSYFWMQILCDTGSSSFVMQVGATAEEEESPTMFIDHPIEYVVGIPRALNTAGEMDLSMQSLAQHLSYGARATDESLDEFSEKALNMTLDLGYLHEGPDPL